jgi:membrane-bound lytic murein transglycosylase D
VHVVRRGESIWAIARRNNMDPKTLMRLNGKKAGDKIMPGERLIVSRGGSGSRAASASSGDRDTGASRVTHRVRSGDTLSGIARRYGVTIAQLVAWNDISKNSVLRVGQRLVVRRGN